MPPTLLRAEEAEDPAFWRVLRPDLSIEAARPAPSFCVGDVPALVDTLRYEGYVNAPGVIPAAYFERLRACVQCLHEHRIPLPFAFVYDEMWEAFQGVAAFVEGALGEGFRALPDFWVWFVLPKETAAGWSPHRDRVQCTLDLDNSPHTLTVWLAFSEATALNGCIYVLPAHLDPRFEERVWDGDGNNVVDEPQNVRAVPATPGSVLAWNQAVLHWGGRASRMAKLARCSAAFEFQRGDRPPFNTPLLDPRTVPPFRQRLGLIGKQVLQYEHMYPLTRDIAALALDLRDRFMPGGAR